MSIGLLLLVGFLFRHRFHRFLYRLLYLRYRFLFLYSCPLPRYCRFLFLFLFLFRCLFLRFLYRFLAHFFRVYMATCFATLLSTCMVADFAFFPFTINHAFNVFLETSS